LGEREGAEWGVREGVGQWGEMTQALYAHMNNKIIIKKKKVMPEQAQCEVRGQGSWGKCSQQRDQQVQVS
jgi:hypothetical protein